MGDNNKPTCVLKLLNMVIEDDLNDNNNYNDLLEDVDDECSKHGNIVTIDIPRNGDGRNAAFVQFDNINAASECLHAWRRKVMGNVRIKAVFYPQDLFEQKIYILPI